MATIPTQANFYKCDSCGCRWVGAWDCGCNETCPECGTGEIEPYDSLTQDEFDADNQPEVTR